MEIKITEMEYFIKNDKKNKLLLINMSGQSLKSALTQRVRIDQAQRLGSQRQNQGEGLMCPASAGHLGSDVYGRPVSQNTLLLNDASCSNYTEFPASRRIEVENLERPYLPICAAGLRGASDFMGKGRDLMPQDLYGDGHRGNFVRHYPTANNAPFHPQSVPSTATFQKKVQPFNYSHDATSGTYRG